MKQILRTSLFISGLFLVLNVSAQSKKFFSVTGEQFGNTNWITFRQADLSSKEVKTLYIPAATGEAVYDAVSGAKLINNDNDAKVQTTPQTCGCINTRMVAAIAYDAKSNRLFYTQMLGNQLRYLDLNSMQPKSYAVTSQALKNFSNAPGEASVITRMVIASDGNGYALTNDNKHLLRFTTDKQITITDLGSLIDAESNNENSIRKQFASWGGDMVADAQGNIYLFTMQQLVYKINPNTRLATFIGKISNMPQDYNVNAAMVEDAENVIVGSSTKTIGYYRVNLVTLQASLINKSTDQVYNVSDFANGNFAFDNKSNITVNTLKTISAYPNPVTAGKLYVQFNNQKTGKYVIQVNEIAGKTIMKKEVKVSGAQMESLSVAAVAAGTYLVRVMDENGEAVYENKIIISKE